MYNYTNYTYLLLAIVPNNGDTITMPQFLAPWLAVGRDCRMSCHAAKTLSRILNFIELFCGSFSATNLVRMVLQRHLVIPGCFQPEARKPFRNMVERTL